ncbi:MAG TPA: hypothetical protein VH092_22990 [Urbifossiella sp.]|nr:hypothetical protein [Urbifossiella sp.]
MITAFIQTRGVTVCPPRTAAGTGWHKPSAAGYTDPDAFQHRKTASDSNEENLAKAKIATMFEDLGGKARSTPGERFKHQNDAYRWFFRPSDFEDWCDTAGYDPEYIREKARQVYENGLPRTRAIAGTGKLYAKRRAYRERTGR